MARLIGASHCRRCDKIQLEYVVQDSDPIR